MHLHNVACLHTSQVEIMMALEEKFDLQLDEEGQSLPMWLVNEDLFECAVTCVVGRRVGR